MNDQQRGEVLDELEQLAQWPKRAMEEHRRFYERRAELLLRAQALGVAARDVADALNRGEAEADDLIPNPIPYYSARAVGQMTRRAEEYAHAMIQHGTQQLLSDEEWEEDDG